MINDIIKEFGEASIDNVQKILFSLHQNFNKGEYAIIGGIAVKLQSKEKSRLLTPDIDIIFHPKVKDRVGIFLKENNFEIIDTGFFVHTLSGKVELDYKFADTNKDMLEYQLLNLTDKIQYNNIEIFIASIEILITMKLDILREKDEKDIILLLKQPYNEKLLCAFICKYTPNKYEDFEQLVQISKIS